MLTLKKIAVTGGLASGKSSTIRFLKELGAYVVSADDIVHQMLSLEHPVGQQVVELLGPDIVINHQIDRTLIAKRVFQDPKLLKLLENIIHPAVAAQLDRLYEDALKEGKYRAFVAEIPLLFEARGKRIFNYDYSIAVISDEQLCKERYQHSNPGKEDYSMRAKNQLPQEEKARRADFIIKNNRSLKDLKQTVTDLFKSIT